MNWKLHKTLSLAVLGITIATLWGLGGIIGIQGLSDKVFNMFTWSQIFGAGLIYVIWSYNKITGGI